MEALMRHARPVRPHRSIWMFAGAIVGVLSAGVASAAGSSTNPGASAAIAQAQSAVSSAQTALAGAQSALASAAGALTATPSASATPTPSPTVSSTPTPSPTSTPTATVGYDHVFLIPMENENRSTIIGNSQAPKLNALASTYAQAGNYHAACHPSL